MVSVVSDARDSREAGSEVRERILRFAERRFAEEGFAACSLSQLCRELRIAKKTFYKHFEGKEALVDAVARRALEAYAGSAGRTLSAELSAAERLEALLFGLFEISAERMSAALMSDLASHRPDLHSAFLEGRRLVLGQVSTLLEEARSEGSYRDDLSTHEVIPLLEAVVERVLDPGVLLERGLAPHRAARLLYGLFRDGMRMPHPTEASP